MISVAGAMYRAIAIVSRRVQLTQIIKRAISSTANQLLNCPFSVYMYDIHSRGLTDMSSTLYSVNVFITERQLKHILMYIIYTWT